MDVFWTFFFSLRADWEMSKELSSESAQELSNDCDSWLQSVRWSSAESIRESSGDCGIWLTAVSNRVSFSNWTTVSPLWVDQGSLTISLWKYCKSGHSKHCTTRWFGSCLLDARLYCLWGSSSWASKLVYRY